MSFPHGSQNEGSYVELQQAMSAAAQHTHDLNEEMNALDVEIMGQENYNMMMAENGHIHGHSSFLPHHHVHQATLNNSHQMAQDYQAEQYIIPDNIHHHFSNAQDSLQEDQSEDLTEDEDEHILHEGYDHDYSVDNIDYTFSTVHQQLQQHQIAQAILEASHQAPPVFQIDAMAQHFHDQTNLDFSDFHRTWATWVEHSRDRASRTQPKPNIQYLNQLDFEILGIGCVETKDLNGVECDFQGIDWKRLGVSREDSRKRREAMYVNYTNTSIPHLNPMRCPPLNDVENFFKFRGMNFTQDPQHAHFQLRNLIASSSRNSVYYACEHKVYQYRPLFDMSATTKTVAMDLTDPVIASEHAPDADWGMAISTVAADHGFLIAGGFGGEYAVRRTDSTNSDYVMGQVTQESNGIINHIQITLNRRSLAPQAVFSNNDGAIRILDITTQSLTQTHKLDFAINCSAVSTDARLRVAVGDSTKVLILNEETGQVLQELGGCFGHQDYGFSAAWADNGFHVATGNQDKMVKIWDARKWTNNNGVPHPLTSIPSRMAGVRSLHFSPIGSGKRVLVAAEQADVVSIIDGALYETKQHFDFYGEILGTSFTPDGQELFVAINDEHIGGIMQFGRCGFGQTSWINRNSKYADDDDDEDDGPGMKFRLGEDGKLHDTYKIEKGEAHRKAMEEGEDWAPTAEESFFRSRMGKTATWRKSKVATTSPPF